MCVAVIGGMDRLARHYRQEAAQAGVDVSWNPWEHTTLSLEYLRGEFDRAFVGDLVSSTDSPAYKRDLVTAQLAFEF